MHVKGVHPAAQRRDLLSALPCTALRAGQATHHSTCCSSVCAFMLRFRRNLFARNLHTSLLRHSSSSVRFQHKLSTHQPTVAMPQPTSRKSTSTADVTVAIVSHTPLLNLHTHWLSAYSTVQQRRHSQRLT